VVNVRSLDRKLVRDLSQLKGQSVAIMLVITAGVGTFNMSLSAYHSLNQGRQRFYRDSRFADVFSAVRRAPMSLAPRIRDLPGVAAAETRLVYDVLLDVPDMSEPARARLISIPPSGRSALNQVYVARGRMLEPGRMGEVVVSEMFAEAHKFRPGSRVSAIINGRMRELTIVGIALSPEYVLQMHEGSLLPDEKRFGIFWMNHEELEAAFDMSGAFNNVSLKLSWDASLPDVKARLDRLLSPYGSVGAYDRSEQLSDQYLSDELSQLRTMAILASSIFFSVAAFLLNIVVSRIISQQREQIAVLKAFGYTNWQVGFHYLSLVLLVSLAGTVAGTLFGLWMGRSMTSMYQQFYKFPLMTFQANHEAILWGFLLTTLATLFGTWWSVRRAIRLPPAEAMRPEPPPEFRPTLAERIFPSHLFPQTVRMILRNIERKPVKTTTSILGIALAVSVLVLGSFSLDALTYLIDFQFRKAQRQDLMVAFVEPATSSVVHELAQLDGVMASETIRAVATRLRFGHRSRRDAIMGVQSDPRLYRLLDVDERPVMVPERGIMLNNKLASLLGASLGDQIIVEVLEGKRPVVPVQVTAIVNEFGGTNAYMHKDQVHQLMGESPVASGAFLKVDDARLDTVFEELRMRPGVATVEIKAAAIESFQKTVAENMLQMRSFNILFAVIIAVGVVYNGARISLSEQRRDLATLRVIGFTQREVSVILLGEIGLLTLVAIPLGWLIGYGLAAGLVMGLDTENYRIPLVVSRSTFAFASVVVIVATLLSGATVQRQLGRLDLVSVLKTRD
jgi:putative ABC transport system permease protein